MTTYTIGSTKLHHSDMYRGGQTIGLDLYMDIKLHNGWHTLRITVVADSHEPQSYAICRRWDGSQWQKLCDTHYSNMKTEYDPFSVSRDKFEEDTKALSKAASRILEDMEHAEL